MKYWLCGIFSFVHFLTFSQNPRVTVIYSPDSTIMGTGVIDGVIKTGLWKFYTRKTNTLFTEGSYKNGERDGTWTSYYPNGKRKDVAEYRAGKLFGPAKYFDEDGALQREMIFQDSMLVGRYTEYYGSSDTPSYIDPKTVKVEGQYENGLKTGQWITYFEFGEIAIREFFEKGLREGPYLEYDPQGNIVTEAMAVKGQFEGNFKRYSMPNLIL